MATQGEPGTPGQVVTLAAAAGMGPERAGSKACSLGRLAAAGLPVPAGFVVTPEAFEAWEAAGPAVAAAASGLGADWYAVRSSAVAEDLHGASYAGMYDTVLNVAPADVPAAVRKVWDSASAGRVAAYQQGGGAAGPP